MADGAAANLRPYDSYKNTGVAWLPSIPETWSMQRNGRLFAQRNETGRPDLPVLEVSLRTGVRVRDFTAGDRKQAIDDRAEYKVAHAGDLAYNMMRMWQGAVGVVPVDGLVSPAYVVARAFDPSAVRYFDHVFRTRAYLHEVENWSRGIVPDRNRLYWEAFKQIQTPAPPPDERQAIVRFLDHMDRRIAKYIVAKKKLFALLNEQKQALIHRVVTRGLDSSVRFKESGVKWLGEIPAHWGVVALSRVSTTWCDGPFGSALKSSHYVDSGVRVVRLQNIGHGEFRNSDSAFVSENHYKNLGDHSVHSGDILIAGLGDDRHPAGRACVAPGNLGPAMVKADCFRFRLRRDLILPDFAAHHLTGTATTASAILSTGATRQRTNLRSTAARYVLLPTLDEQIAIVNHINTRSLVLRNALDAVEKDVSLMREFRARLAADVVTGKLDVREAAAYLPQEIEDATDLADPLDDATDEDTKPEEEEALE